MIKKGARKRSDEAGRSPAEQILRLVAANERIQAEYAELRRRDELRALERSMLRALLDTSPDYLYAKDVDCRFVVANATLAGDSGVTPDDLVGKSDFDIHAPEPARRFFAREREIMRTGQVLIEQEELIVTAAGEEKWYASTKLPLRNEHGDIVGIVGIARNITDRKRADLLRAEEGRILEMIAGNAELEAVLDRLIGVIEAQLDGILGSVLLLDDDRCLTICSGPSLPEAYNKLTSRIPIGPSAGSCGTAAYRREPVIVSDIDTDPLWAGFKELALQNGLRSCWSTPILSHSGQVLGTFAMYSRTIRHPIAAELALVTMATRIAGIAIERRRAALRIHHMAHHDALTGLPNRASLKDRLERAIADAARGGPRIAVAFLDLDNFKLVNDSLGHNAGDELLKTVAARMIGCLRSTDTVVRLGGDEFVILLSEQPDAAEALTDTLHRLKDGLARPVVLAGRSLQIGCSIGIAVHPRDGAHPEALLMNADAAMYRAKELGRNNVQFYSPGLDGRSRETLALQEGLRRALDRGEFLLHYQPQLDLRTGRVFGAEALLRWQHPERGLIPPAQFIPVAEEAGLIVPIGNWVVEEACRQNRAWQRAGLEPLTVAVNVSARQFRERCWIARVAKALYESGLAARYLELELTESLIMQDAQAAVATMRELQTMGVQLSIDDFGTGYSSLHALKRFPVARLKIDRNFVRDLGHSEDDRAITTAVISLAHRLGLKVIAEGVETEEQLAFLRANDCDEMQGHLTGRPMSAEDLAAFLASRG